MFFQDVRYALRNLWLNRGFAAVGIFCLALGIGINTMIFSVVDGVLIQPFPYADPENIVAVGSRNDRLNLDFGSVSFLDLRDWRDHVTMLTGLSGSSGRSLTLSDGVGDPERFQGAAVSWDLFPMLGMQPAWGRLFTSEDDKVGAPAVALLSYEVWTNRYQSSPSVIGRRVLINAAPYEVVGVMPPRFQFPSIAKMWIPLTPSAASDARNNRGVRAFARLKPGVTMARAQEEIVSFARQLAQTYPATNEGWSAAVMSLRTNFIPPDISLVLWLMMAGATLVLTIACSNVANLQLARATVRRKEISIRTALGAARGRIIRQLLTESTVLALTAVPLGLVLAHIGDRVLTASMAIDRVPYYIQWRIDWRSVVYTVIVAAGTAVVFGLVPALHASRGNLHESLKDGTRGNTGSRSWARNILVGAEVALSLVVLVAALLFVRTFTNLDKYPTGFDTRPLMTMRFFMPGPEYDAPDAKLRRVEDIVARVEALPGVQSVFASNLIPLNGGGGGGAVIIDGHRVDKGREPFIDCIGVTPRMLRTLNISVVRGRDFTDAEGWTHTPVAIINQTMARQFWPNEDPLGRRFRLADGAPDWFVVIGVMHDIVRGNLNPNGQPTPGAFVPYAYQQVINTGLTIRVDGDPARITTPVREQLRQTDSTLPMFQILTMEEARRLSFWQYGVFGWVFSAIGIIGLILAGVGVYGVLSYSVSQRQQEIGVRMALGAAHRDVLKLIVWQGMRLALSGVGVGLLAAAAAMPVARGVLYNVSPFDPASFAIVAVFLIFVAAFASYIPARRATLVNPVVALRGE